MLQYSSIILHGSEIQCFDVSARWCSALEIRTTRNDVVHFTKVGNVRAALRHFCFDPLLSYVSVHCLLCRNFVFLISYLNAIMVSRNTGAAMKRVSA